MSDTYPKVIPVLVIPHYNRPDLLERCLRSIDFPVAHLVIVRNGSEDDLPRGHIQVPIEHLHILRHPNAGVAASWNEAIKLFPASFWMLVNNDIAFAPGDLERMYDAALADPDAACFYANHGASFWTVTANGIARVGLFDENFYPAYLEDCDWSYRADLLEARRVNVPGCSSIHGDDTMTGSCTVNSDPKLRVSCGRTHGRNFEYYKAKWGGINEKETFKTPFNHPAAPVSHWTFDPYMRKEQQW
jgi:GT2 family glycosyltransferase